MPPAQPELLPPALAGYIVEGILGRGGFGAVFAARSEADGSEVALKLAPPGHGEARAQLSREAEVLALLDETAAPRLFASGTLEDGTAFLTLERIRLPLLAERLAQACGPLPPTEAAAHLVALAAALAPIHAAGVAHLDLKPENLFCDPAGARIIDFGLASSPLHPALPSGASSYAGTAEYMAPEQCDGSTAPGRHTDLYALGVIFYEMLTGRPPFLGSRAEVHQAQIALRPPRPSSLAQVPPALDEIALRCLAKSPSDRFPELASLRYALAAALEQTAPLEQTAAPQQTAALEQTAAPQLAIAPQPAGLAPASERRQVGVLYFSSAAGAPAVQAALVASGGQLAHAGRGRFTGVFDGEASDHPLRRAVFAAHALFGEGLTVRALVDLASVAMQRRSSGPARYLSAAFAREDLQPRETDPAGLHATAVAAPLLTDQLWQPLRDSLFHERTRSGPGDSTAVMLGAGPLVGREELLCGLLDGARRAIETPEPTLAVITAESGYGKSHLCAALVDGLRAALATAELIEVRAREPVVGDADEGLRSLLRRTLELGEGSAEAGRAQVFAALGEELGLELWPAVALTLGFLPPDDPALLGLRAAPGVLRALSVRALGEGLRRRAASRPVCLVLDDAQWADDATLDALQYATLAEAAAPLWVCALGRPAFEAARPGFGERAARSFSRTLGPLDPPRAADLCRLLLLPAQSVPAEAIERLVQRSQGVPLQLVELVRGLKREGILRQSGKGESWYLATEELERLPALAPIEWLAQRELSVHGPDLAAHARLAALLGAETTPIELAGVFRELERDGAAEDLPLDPAVATRRLLAAGLLVAGRNGGVRFRHALVRDAVARSTPQSLRERVHPAAVRYYRSTREIPEVRRLPLLALHAQESGLAEEAATLYLELAERSRKLHAYLDAETTYSRALELFERFKRPSDAGRLRALSGRAGMRYRIGRYEDSIADYARARELAEGRFDAGAVVEILLDEATARDWINDHAGSRELVDKARELCARRGLSSPVLRAGLLLGEGRALLRSGRWAESAALLDEAAALAGDLGDQGYETLVISLLLLVSVLPPLGRIEEAERIYQRVVALASARKDRLHLGSALNNRRNIMIARKDVPRALDDQRSFMRIGRELGFVIAEFVGEFNLGELNYQSGDLDAAESHARRAVAIERRHPEVVGRPVAALLHARLLAYRGQSGEARALLEGIRATLGPLSFSASDEVLACMVDLSTRVAAPAEWEALLARSAKDSLEQEPIEVVEMRGLSALRSGERAEARRSFERALEVARGIPNILEPRLRSHLAAL